MRWYVEAVIKALTLGYRHIDTAQTYENEAYISKAIRSSQVPRDDIFLTSKLDPSQNSYQGALDGCAESRQALGTTPDMYLIHYPGDGDPIEAWRGLVDAKADGLCRRIGVSNFEKSHLAILFERTGEAPALNQIEFHPHLWCDRLARLVDFCHQNDILVEGYSPYAEGETGLLEQGLVLEIARNHDTTPGRVIVKWCMQHGVRPIVGSLSEKHMSENLGPYDFVLTEKELSRINGLGASQFRLSLKWGWDPTTVVLR